jgi:YD repeat-containing protein
MMNYDCFKKGLYKKTVFLFLCAFLLLLLNNFTAFAVTETIQYGYDDAGQVTKVTYDDDTDVEYVYDGAGNRQIKTVTLTGEPANNLPYPPLYSERGC